MNADVNGAVNIRRKITQSPPTGDMSNGWLAQPGVFLFDRESEWRTVKIVTLWTAIPVL
jgi:putative transposase